MENNNRVKNKRIIAIALALGLLVITLLANNFVQRSQISTLESVNKGGGIFNDFINEEMEKKVLQGTNADERILVVPIYGLIGQDGSSTLGEGSYDHENILNSLDQAIEDPTIKGVILEINSPGGAVYHSAEIWHKIKELQEKRPIPIYASMGFLAASGGYYVAAPADKIYAANETTTGSIGVISTFYNYQELAEKIGVEKITFKSAEHKDMNSSMREMTEEEKRINQAGIDEMYNEFLNVVEDGRGHILSRAEIERLADGRTYSGKEAVENGLIDEIGYFDKVLEDIIEDLNLEDPQVFKVEKFAPSFTGLFPGLVSKTKTFTEIDLMKKIEDTGMSRPGLYYLYGGY